MMENVLVENIETSKLIDLFSKNQKSFYLYIANYAALQNNGDEKENKPLRYHRINDLIDCIFSPGIVWSFYNAILDTDICSTVRQHRTGNADQTIQKILSLASNYRCPIRATVKTTATDTEKLLQRYGFFELPMREDAFQYVDFSNDNQSLKDLHLSSDVKVYELDDRTQEDCSTRKAEWGYVLCKSFDFRNPDLHGPFYSNVWKRVEVGPMKPVRMFIALNVKNDQVVGGCHVSLAHGIACLFNVTTLKSERGKGIGKALSVMAMNSAKELNYRYMVLQSSEMGSYIYKQLGFRPIPSYKTFVKLSTVAWYYKVIEVLIETIGIDNLKRLFMTIRKKSKSFLWLMIIMGLIFAIVLATVSR